MGNGINPNNIEEIELSLRYSKKDNTLYEVYSSKIHFNDKPFKEDEFFIDDTVPFNMTDQAIKEFFANKMKISSDKITIYKDLM